MTEAQHEIAVPEQQSAPVEPDPELVPSPVPARRRRDVWAWLVVGLIAAVAGGAYGWGANTAGVEMYYVGAVRTMSSNWHAFLFGGFDPAGTLTLDKLPGSFWIQALVVRAFGMHTWCFIAPQIAAGVGTVVVMFVAVRRLTGPRTGILAALTTAALPATAVMSRGNTADAISVLLLVLAGAAAAKSLTTGRLLMAAVWIGLAFQAKMIEAWAIVPGLLAAYLLAAPGSMKQRLRRAGIAGAVMVAVSLSYMTAVTLTPAADRPYVDGSSHNSIYQQVFEYNGVNRIGAKPGYGLGATAGYTPTSYAIHYTEDVYPEQVPPSSISHPGPFRLIRGPLGRDVGWLLPVALVCLIALLIATRRRPRTDLVRAGVILWGGWLVTFTAVFSASDEVLSYYLGILVPPIAALGALGSRTLYRTLRKRRARPATLAAYALGLAVTVAAAPLLDPGVPRGVTVLIGFGLVVMAVGLVLARLGGSRTRRAGLLAATASLLLTPALATTSLAVGHGGSFDAPYTAGGTYQQQSAELAVERLKFAAPVRPPTYGGVVYPSLDKLAWLYLDELRYSALDDRHLTLRVVIFTSAEASRYVVAGVPDIEVIGGYTGLVDQPTASTLRAQLAAGDIGYAIVPGDGDVRSADPRVQLIESTCTLVDGGDPKSMAAQEYECAG